MELITAPQRNSSYLGSKKRVDSAMNCDFNCRAAKIYFSSRDEETFWETDALADFQNLLQRPYGRDILFCVNTDVSSFNWVAH